MFSLTRTPPPRRIEPDSALALDILSALLIGGTSLAEGLRQLAAHLPGAEPLRQVATMLELSVPWDDAWAQVAEYPELTRLGEHLHFVHTAAIPSSQLLLAIASTTRRQRKRQAEQLAAELGIKLVVPMGVCLLPSFICLGVLPVLISLLPAF